MIAKQKEQIGKSALSADLQLAFDVGHSSIGWAVLQTDTPAPSQSQMSSMNILGCGVVTFGADDCLASRRRNYRRQRRHTRSTRKRIEGIEKLLAHLNIFMPEQLQEKHKPGGGHSVPWLLAARVLAARTERDKEKAKLTWEELWDVLRWYAHNRGYDGNIRYSEEYNFEAFSNEPQLTKADIELQVEDSSNNEQVFEKIDEVNEDSEKLRAGAELMERDFATSTFAETVAKILLGPDRKVKLGQPGKPGKLEDAQDKLSEVAFRQLLFETAPEFKNHPRHLTNYFKGIGAAFPRRVIKEISGIRTLTGGTEWEVRYILRQHRHLKFCDDQFERAICGQIPDSNKAEENWRIYEKQQPTLYLQK